MADHRERACQRCGSLTHHEDDGRCGIVQQLNYLAVHAKTGDAVANLAARASIAIESLETQNKQLQRDLAAAETRAQQLAEQLAAAEARAVGLESAAREVMDDCNDGSCPLCGCRGGAHDGVCAVLLAALAPAPEPAAAVEAKSGVAGEESSHG